MATKLTATRFCDSCNTSEHNVTKLIQVGDKDIFICGTCVAECINIISEANKIHAQKTK